jgi:phosphohistidine phosphatase
MDLILWRHAEAEDGLPDAARRLTARGRKQAAKLARWLKKRLPEGARVLASPAARAVETAAALGLACAQTKRVGTGATASAILGAAGWPNAGGTVVVVGHQPGLGRAAALLLGGEPADWNVRKGAVWWFTCRSRGGTTETTLRAVIGPDLA